MRFRPAIQWSTYTGGVGPHVLSAREESMKAIKISLSILAIVMCVSAVGVALAADDAAGEPAHSIKDVMKLAHKDGLLKKVLAGDASQEEKLKLLDYYISLVQCEPPKGDIQSWHNLAGRSALAAAKMAVGRDGAAEELKAATNCAACHDAHKGE